jgi:MFS family permease
MMNRAKSGERLISIFFILSGLFTMGMFYRVSTAVIAPDLAAELGLNAEQLGILGGAVFYCFALLQIPVGPMLDRIGPRLVIGSCGLIMAMATFLFAGAHSFHVALVARGLMGLGMAPLLMGSLKVYTVRFPANQFATLMGIMLCVGTLGNFLAYSPLAYLSASIGWRTCFIVAGVVNGIFALLTFWILADPSQQGQNEPAQIPANSPVIGVRESARILLGSFSFWQISVMSMFRYGTIMCLQTLWLALYLMDAKGCTPVQTGNLLLFLALGNAIGNPIAGRLSDRTFRSRKWVTFWGTSLYCISLLPYTGLFTVHSTLVLAGLIFITGLFNSFGNLVFSHARELYPLPIAGTAFAWINFFTVSGGAILLPVLGNIIESFPHTGRHYPPEAYELAFMVCFVAMAGSLVLYAFSKKESADKTRSRS